MSKKKSKEKKVNNLIMRKNIIYNLKVIHRSVKEKKLKAWQY